MKFIINDEIFEMSPFSWPEGSTFRVMHEGDRDANEYKLANPRLKKDSIRLIIDIVTENIDKEILNPDDVNWNELKLAVDYLGICSSLDYIYPLFLTKKDRKNWYNRENNLIIIKPNSFNIRDPNYDVIGKDAFGKEIPFRHYDDCTDIIKYLSHIKGLFISGDYASAKLSDFKKPWLSIDIFAYGHDSLDHIKEAVKICLKYSKKSYKDCDPVSFRDNILIAVPITSKNDDRFWVNVRFILIEFRNPSHILNNIDLDSLCIGFKIEDPDIYYSLPRFVRAYETNSNTFDPSFRDSEYIVRLINATLDGFDIAIPGVAKKNLKISPVILKRIMDKKESKDVIGIQAIIISALLNIKMNDRLEFMYLMRHFYEKLRYEKKGQKTGFIIDDILNEGQRDFIFKNMTYIPEYPRIELVSKNRDEICQVQNSYYGRYYMD
uniref:Ankyrin repeat protein n=1 Tax=Pithovirus LCPAC401 TaxID=2506595 RepID=A0A481Z9T4_9VIRU|nr:MAG: hypothetical protein LCPAC401_02150 [Pithovirus LCPAC401]